ncbi:hypothetical protein V5799_011520 [Amblyomma americanum]|uniref:Uncharacterized protein n=1 Tax=Amblyomma americanum TaxID=6943 RepID=A0AAQ4EGP3_AMBAM
MMFQPQNHAIIRYAKAHCRLGVLQRILLKLENMVELPTKINVREAIGMERAASQVENTAEHAMTFYGIKSAILAHSTGRRVENKTTIFLLCRV